MLSKIKSVMTLVVLMGAAAAASEPTAINEDSAEARRLSDSFLTDAYDNIGCYGDESNPRIMGLPQTSSSSMTTELCADICSDILGTMYFGTQYGDECFCGDEDTDYEYYGPSDDCDHECSGDVYDICGGSFAMSVFEYINGTTGAADDTTFF